ncbi:hypothetical protein SAMN00777080_3286 [Aquiflexum balticum DSM 16537]|uniref:ZP domain-containing protein n=1 Tax=Aquiflexum balticum DSM 16537 TaxID=758820 RepID=A0A1W2H6U0_9BACT|nr:hypothetical protein [Aquiflexum balticum]SMD44660.1 hypothetical protein SAMN00777080_3286 [Aquiflexum balticum DSM 16537]
MKQSNSFKFILFSAILFACSMTGCQETEFPNLKCRVKSVSGPVDDVVGKWKLVQREDFNMQSGKITRTDYSCKNIIYYFTNDGIVRVENHGELALLFKDGEYEYTFSTTPFHETMEGNTLKMGVSSWPCYIQPGNMVLDASPLDGEILRFVRVE